MTPAQDLFVGIVAVIFGALLVIGAILDSPHLMALGNPRRLAETIGKPWARSIIAAVGLAIIAMGGLIASGWQMPW